MAACSLDAPSPAREWIRIDVADFAGFSVRCVVTNECGEFFSDEAQLIAANAWIVQHPADLDACSPGVATFVVVAGGQLPISYEWQAELAPDEWSAVTDGVFVGNPAGAGCAVVQGANSDQIQISGYSCWPSGYIPPRLRCVASNAIGSATSNPASFATHSCCPADLDDGSGAGTRDGGVDISDLLFFLANFEAGNIANVDLDNGSGSGTPDGGVDINDLLFFLSHFEGGC